MGKKQFVKEKPEVEKKNNDTGIVGEERGLSHCREHPEKSTEVGQPEESRVGSLQTV